MNRRPLTQEEKGESARLTDAWRSFQENNRGATQSWLASASGLGTQGAVSQYLRGAIPLNLQALLAICRVIEADPYFISPRLTNALSSVPNKVIEIDKTKAERIHEKYIQQAERNDAKRLVVGVADSADPRFTFIPKVRLRLTAGISGFAVEPEGDEDEPSTAAVPTDWVVQRGYSPTNLIAIHVRGESMEPTFYAGDLVVLNTADSDPVDGGVYAINYEGEPVVKRMSRDAGQWWLTSDNADQRKFGRKVCAGESCIIVGRIVRRETERF